MSLEESWPRPRVGQRLKLRSGRVVEVVLVRTARDVLRGMTELEAVLMGPKNAALYGIHWLEIYYEVEVRPPNSVDMFTVRPNDVESILD